MRIVLIGPPGAGKGTQGVRLATEIKSVHLATGDILRAESEKGTDLGKLAKQYMDKGDLVPDEVIIGVIRARLSETDNVILDGFPRTVTQAEALDNALEEIDRPLDVAIYINVDQDELVNRLIGRASRENRSDDNPETVKRRMTVYAKQSEPVLNYYRLSGRMKEVDGMGTTNEVYGRLRKALPD